MGKKSLWDDYGIIADILVHLALFFFLNLQPQVSPKHFTHGFPCADIHELLSPDLLHQIIKGTFKDHLITWVTKYIEVTYPPAEAKKILADIDHW